ncbi:glycosyltransferase family A protein [Hymenobacter sp. 15J16-1T3B]|uniref:glycosyltransferase family A protein n=1 Tax=Hymenobacter sp. 15J16-1T3B TaxID=2886941 RepID=UPI001D11EBDD|nr:glycosyltransferase family A protein [Hymenobacter sp. 15J16-1T3B]
MAEYTLSYVLTTYNKLPYLQQVLERLIAARQPDEEIVVADGGSKDGTPEYLRGLYEAGKIQQFVSERDKGEAHGFNKCMLMARGELIKIITDDDAFCYPAIREAKSFMLAHPEIDVLSGNTGLIHLEDLGKATIYDDVADNFQRWLNSKAVVWMIGLPLIIRRKSLALTGLFHTGVVQVDTEFTYRITSLNVNLAWSTAMLSVRIENPQSNFRVMNQGKAQKASALEANRMRFYYDKSISDSVGDFVKHKSGWMDAIKKPIRPAKRVLYSLLRLKQYQGNQGRTTSFTGEMPTDNMAKLATAFDVCDQFMATYNAEHPTEFYYKSDQLTKVLS